MNLIIRDMRPEDADAVGSVYYRCWQETYRGMVDPGYLAAMSEEACRETARRWPGNTAVAAADGKVVGFGSWCLCQDEPKVGELSALYVLPQWQGMGLGRRLLDCCVEKLSGCERARLWALEENRRAIGFYQHCGFALDGRKHEVALGVPTSGVRLEKKI